jgi:hypothetical protein
MTRRGILLWCMLLWVAVLFTPAIRVAGIPIRLDDLLVFGAGAVLVCERILAGSLPRPGFLGTALLAQIVCTIVVTSLGSPVPGLSVGVKEYLDFLRPLKFLLVFLIVQRGDPEANLRMMYRILPAAVAALASLAILQQVLLTPESDNILARYSLAFSVMPVEDFRRFFGYRPFATFSTPADLGYLMSVIIVLAAVDRAARGRAVLLVGATTALILSGTRTFLFSMPLVLLAAMLASRSRRGAGRLLAAGFVMVLATAWALTRGSTGASQEAAGTARALLTRNVEDQESITGRLQNLALVVSTWQDAPLTGVISRDRMDPTLVGGVDSEYVMTFHRYGLLGIALLLGVYGAAAKEAWSRRRVAPEMSRALLLVVGLTFVYGLTQGALINSRLGGIPLYLLGALCGVTAAARARVAQDATGPALVPAGAGD